MQRSAKFMGLAAVTTAALCAPACGAGDRDYGAALGGTAGSNASGGKVGTSGGKPGQSGGASNAGEGGEQTQAGSGTIGVTGGAGGVANENGGSGFGGITASAGAAGTNEQPGSSGAGGEGGSVPVLLAPDTRITSTPPNPDNVAMPSFQFTSTLANSSFQCKLDAGAYAACTSPRVVALGADGPHTFSVYAIAEGVADPSPATYTWTLDTVPPSIAISIKPPAVTADTSANFTFSAEAGATVACSLDSGAFAACTSMTTHSVTGLATGNHTFTVRATDAANNTATATATWYIEPPCAPVTIEAESFAPVTGWAISMGSVLHAGKALANSGINAPFSFTFQGKGLIIYNEKGPNVGKHTVSIDGATPVTVTATDANGFSFQNPTTIASGLPNAVHTATVTCIQQYCEIDYFNVTCQ